MALNPGQQSPIDEPLYNSRLIKNHLEYLRKFHPNVDVDEILRYAWIRTYEVEDEGHWFSQWQIDRFHEILIQKTGDSGISRKVGRYAASSEASGVLKNYALGFMTPGAAYWLLEKIAPHLSRAATFKTRKLGANKFEITSIPKQGAHPKPYQCDSLMGQLEALSKLFTGKYPKVEHSECIHSGGEVCRYIVTMEETASLAWRRLRRYLVFAGIPVFVVLHSVIPSISWFALIVAYSILFLVASWYFDHLEAIQLTKTVESQRDTVGLLLDQINRRYNEAQLVKEIGQTISTQLDTTKLLSSVIRTIGDRLDFDRGGIWLVNKEKDRLCYHVGFGYEKEIEEELKRTDFHIDKPNSRGPAVVAFRQQRPILVNDVGAIEGDLSKRTVEFIKGIGVRSFICVPIVYERQSFGVLSVDNLMSKRPLNQSDMSLLTGVATQIAISIHNAQSYQKIQENREQERNLRRLFEKYVPPPVIKRYANSEDVDLFKGEERTITALFLDIRGFTSSSESMEPRDVVSFLNSYFDKCSMVISEANGHINKYTGDGFFAVFGAPEAIETHVVVAFDAARRILEMSKNLVLEGRPMKIGIGLHTGKAVVGNIGSETKIEYTAVGDTVNTAARLQEFTKYFQNFPIIMSRAVWEALAEHPDRNGIINLGSHKVRGKKEKLEAFGFTPYLDRFSSELQSKMGFIPLQKIKNV
jgi:class 3 adenylate cyclase/putative methionine-R-sulfoxide reductase with GAF domain